MTAGVTLVGVSQATTTPSTQSSTAYVDVDPSDLEGTGTEADPYVITNASELQAMEDDLDAHYILGADVNASGTTEWNNGKGFAPIGNNPDNAGTSPEFSGSFDGAGHTITGLTINRPDESYVGLFGYVNDTDSVVRNVSIQSTSIRGSWHVGALVGTNWHGTIEYTSSRGIVDGDRFVGGIVGSNYRAGTITNTSVSGSVNGSKYVGGLVGRNDYGTIANSSASAHVNGSDNVGGLVGGNYYGPIKNTFAVGSVNGASDVGGIAGQNPTKYGDSISDSYWDINTTGQRTSDGGGTALTTAEMTGESARTNMSGFDFGTVWTTQPGSYPTLRSSAPEGTGSSSYVDVNVSDLPGNGTEADPYVITNASELQAMEDDLDAHYKLGADINASGTAQWNKGSGFDPIGENPYNDSLGEAFTGTFDGAGHSISGLTINRPTEDTVGLFGYIDTGAVRNVSLRGQSVAGLDVVGGLAGRANASSVQNASANGTVNGSTAVGGLIGSVANGTVQNASTGGTVNGSVNVGGLTGYLSVEATIQRSAASASVTGVEMVGGLVGNNYAGTIQNASASGEVNGSRYVGGLVGTSYGGTIQNTFAVGNVNGFDYYIGGLVGYKNLDTITASYWDVNTTGLSDSAGGTALTTAEMTGEAARTNMSGLDFGTVWTTRPGDYPELRAVPTGPAPQLTIDVVPESSQTSNGSVITFDIVLTNTSNGVGAYEGRVTVSNETVASITATDLNGDPELSNVTMVGNNTTVIFNAALADTANTGRVVIASIQVEATGEGTSEVGVQMGAIGSESGSGYQITSVSNATLNVTGIEPLQGAYSGPPADIDGDGVYEDINGDGEFNIVDVQALYSHRNSTVVQANENQFDVNGDGEVDIVDVQALYVESKAD